MRAIHIIAGEIVVFKVKLHNNNGFPACTIIIKVLREMISVYLTPASAFCVFAIILIFYYASVRYQEHRLIKRLGGYAPTVYGRLPFGKLIRWLCASAVLTDNCVGIDL